MKTFGILLLVFGTVIGAFGGARLPKADLPVSALGLVLLAAGGLVLFFHRRAHAAALSQGPRGVPVFRLMQELPEKLQPILDEAEQLTLPQIAERIGNLQLDYFKPIADAAPALLGSMGTDRFARVFGAYAGGERLISRAWSAAVDHHRPEAINSLREGIARIRQAAASATSER